MSLPLSTEYTPHTHSTNMTTNISPSRRHQLSHHQKHQNLKNKYTKSYKKYRETEREESIKGCGFLLNSNGGGGEKGKRSSHYLREFQLTLSPSVISC